MSDVIHLLPDSVANQIAAGEVIQRPASVIKELVENAVDAGAKTINVLVVDAGRTSIQVIDDGKGMSQTDARLSFERHATSKILNADDLFNLHTMGFRGEALASIAAVAQVELKTRMAGEEVGTILSIAGSRITDQQPVSCPVGSNFKVENLFFNVPARRKFLKSNATELSNIITAYERIALVYPEIAFTMHSNGTEIMNLRQGTPLQRIVDICGKKLHQDLLPVDVDTTLCHIKGFVGKPEAAKKKGANTYLFVNGRFMRHAYFHKAIMNAYERLVPIGMTPPYFIYFDVAAKDIDVNIHPTKTEIKFENEQAIWQILSAAVKDAIGRFCEIPSIDFDSEEKPIIPVFNPEQTISSPKPDFNPSYNPFNRPARHSLGRWEDLYNNTSERITQDISPIAESVSQVLPLEEDRAPAHYQYKGKYIMTSVKSGLMIIDQRRADIRIRYEQFLQYSSNNDTQRLLFPELIQLTPAQQVIFESLLPELEAMGFEFSDLGGGDYSIIGVPANLNIPNYVGLIENMIEDTEGTTNEIKNIFALSMARHSAITYGEVLTNNEMENLVNQLFRCSDVNHTPDGKLIMSILPQKEIEQLLG